MLRGYLLGTAKDKDGVAHGLSRVSASHSSAIQWLAPKGKARQRVGEGQASLLQELIVRCCTT